MPRTYNKFSETNDSNSVWAAYVSRNQILERGKNSEEEGREKRVTSKDIFTGDPVSKKPFS